MSGLVAGGEGRAVSLDISVTRNTVDLTRYLYASYFPVIKAIGCGISLLKCNHIVRFYSQEILDSVAFQSSNIKKIL